MTNEEYWAKRMAESQQAISDKTINQVEKTLKKYYKTCSNTVISEFEYTYLKILEQIHRGDEPSPALLYKLDTYWQFQQTIRDELKKLGDLQIEALTNAFMENFFDVYNCFVLKSDNAFISIDKEGALELINSIWCADRKVWSERVWENTNNLYRTLNNHLVNSIVVGQNSAEMKAELVKRFRVSWYEADRLVRTEMAHVQNEAARQRYLRSGVKQMEVWANPDERRCEFCGELHQKRFAIDEQIPVPAHPNCRCCIIPVVEGLDIKQELD